MPVRRMRVKMLRCSTTACLSEVVTEDGTRRKLDTEDDLCTSHQGRWGLAIVDGGRLVEFRPDPRPRAVSNRR